MVCVVPIDLTSSNIWRSHRREETKRRHACRDTTGLLGPGRLQVLCWGIWYIALYDPLEPWGGRRAIGVRRRDIGHACHHARPWPGPRGGHEARSYEGD